MTNTGESGVNWTPKLARICSTEPEQARLHRYLEHLRAKGCKDGTIEDNRKSHAAVAKGVSEITGAEFDVASVSGVELRVWRSRLIEEGKKPATINHRLCFLRAYVTWCFGQGLINEQVPEALAGVRDVAMQVLAPKSLDDDELRRLLKAVENGGSKRDQAIFALLLTGLRASEVVGLRVSDLRVYPSKGSVIIQGEHVKGSKYREVPLGAEARRALLAYLSFKRPTTLVFDGKRGLLCPNGLYKLFVKYCALTGVKASPHSCRHTFAKRYLAATQNDLVGLSQALGHSSVSVSARYARRSLADLQVGVERCEF